MDEDRLAGAIRRAQQRDEAGFDVLIGAYAPRLFGYLARLTGSRQRADDLLQEVFVRLVRRIGEYQHDGRFDAWIFRIATNVARDDVRQARRRRRIDGVEGVADGNGEAFGRAVDHRGRRVDAALETRDELDRLQRAIDELSPAEREVILLRHFSEMSFAEIANVMETPIGTALARAHRGLGRLRAAMGEAHATRRVNESGTR
jgi:RNA polymerase sigma-70 factor (ECF subfamily)